MSAVQKPFAFLWGTDIERHASETREGERYEYDGYEVHPVLKRWFRFNSTGGERRHTVSTNPKESAAHLVAKSLIKQGIPINCEADGERVHLRLRNVQIETRVDNRTPDVRGIIDYCVPCWHLSGTMVFIEVHFANRVRDADRIADLCRLGAPVLEIHLPAKYLRSTPIEFDEPARFRGLIRAVLTNGYMAGTWIARTTPPPLIVTRNALSPANGRDI